MEDVGPLVVTRWDRLDDAIAVHGHGGATRTVWADTDPDTTRTTPDTAGTAPSETAATSTDTIRTPPAEPPALGQAWIAERAELLRTIDALRRETDSQRRHIQLLLGGDRAR
ncbi:hypothetical protein [Streptomyces sp. ISL-11]|uniref:hypothetical protein n=1 Tax=Streptomyces sp. ISL-11 TaxID=2819174 RepID=UPI001BECC7D2|nr:hypothetical protein [Streptomyces sp. ISL-11]MBT2384440.1 hypothetical protein [Streptomyces sp. ISL-11]